MLFPSVPSTSPSQCRSPVTIPIPHNPITIHNHNHKLLPCVIPARILFYFIGSYLAVSQDWLSEQWELMAEQPWFRGDMNRKDAKKELNGTLILALFSRYCLSGMPRRAAPHMTSAHTLRSVRLSLWWRYVQYMRSWYGAGPGTRRARPGVCVCVGGGYLILVVFKILSMYSFCGVGGSSISMLIAY